MYIIYMDKPKHRLSIYIYVYIFLHCSHLSGKLPLTGSCV